MIGDPTRAGDLAVVIRNRYPENIGAIVRVASVVEPHCSMFGEDRRVKVLGPMTGKYGPLVHGDVVIAIDAWLKPLRPPAPEQSVEREEHLAGVV